MVHHPPGGAPRHAPPLSSLTTSLAGNRAPLAPQLAACRAEIAALEAAWVAAAEQDVARGLPRGVRIHDRQTWDRSTWDRYLAAAAAIEPEYKGRLRRLYQQIDNLERPLARPNRPLCPAACRLGDGRSNLARQR